MKNDIRNLINMPIFCSIWKKAKRGRRECKKRYGFIGKPWVTPLSEEERTWLYEMHNFFYGKDWRISDSLGGTQVQYIMFNNIKNKYMRFGL